MGARSRLINTDTRDITSQCPARQRISPRRAAKPGSWRCPSAPSHAPGRRQHGWKRRGSCLLYYRHQRLLRRPARLRDRREVAALAQLRDVQCGHLDVHQPLRSVLDQVAQKVRVIAPWRSRLEGRSWSRSSCLPSLSSASTPSDYEDARWSPDRTLRQAGGSYTRRRDTTCSAADSNETAPSEGGAFQSVWSAFRGLASEEKQSIARHDAEDEAVEIERQSAHDDEHSRHQNRRNDPMNERGLIDGINAIAGENHHHPGQRGSQRQHHQREAASKNDRKRIQVSH